MESSMHASFIFSKKPSVFAGDYQITNAALAKYGVAREKFGSTDIILSAERKFNVKDYQYLLDSGDVGMRFLPINEYGSFIAADGKEVWASELVDNLLRKKMNLQETDPIFAYMYYIHPELNNDTISNFAATEKMEMGVTHLGSYYGMGVTSNSPPLYHNRRWGVVGSDHGYPCNVMVLTMADTDQAMLNKNLQLTDKFLNNGVRFPVNYKESTFRMADLNTCFMFYRDWIYEESYLKTDPTWFTYCAAHKTLVTTIAVNLPHNLRSFKEVYGESEGDAFWKFFTFNYFSLFGEEFTADKETDFEPLWKKDGLTSAQIKPFTKEEYVAYDEARRENKLDTFTGFKPLSPTQGTPWAPQMTSDVILNFVAAYANFIDAGALVCCATLMAFRAEVTKRMVIDDDDYLQHVMPIIELIMLADAKTKALAAEDKDYKQSAYYKTMFSGLFIGYGGKAEDLPAILNQFESLEAVRNDLTFFTDLISTTETSPENMAWWSLNKIRDEWENLQNGTPISVEETYKWMSIEIKGQYELARKIVGPAENSITFNTPPAIAHMIEIGFYEKNPHNLSSIIKISKFD